MASDDEHASKGDPTFKGPSMTRKRESSPSPSAPLRKSRRIQSKTMDAEKETHDDGPKEESQSIPVEGKEKRQLGELRSMLDTNMQQYQAIKLEDEIKDWKQKFQTFEERERCMEIQFTGWHDINEFNPNPDFMSCVKKFAFYETIPDIHSLSSAQKKEIIASLEGYCVQEDLDAILARLPPPVRDRMSHNFVSMLLYKDIIEKMFSNPFWHFHPDLMSLVTHPDDDEMTERELAIFRTYLGRLIEQFQGRRPVIAHTLRHVMVRLQNPKALGGNTETFAVQSDAYREKLAKRMAFEMMANKVLKSLLKKAKDKDDASRRLRWLEDIYMDAALTSIKFTVNQDYVVFQTMT